MGFVDTAMIVPGGTTARPRPGLYCADATAWAPCPVTIGEKVTSTAERRRQLGKVQ